MKIVQKPKSGFLLELEALKDLSDNYLFISLIDSFTSGGKLIMVLEFPGLNWFNLYDFIYYNGPCDSLGCQKVMRQIVDGLTYMRSKNYVHNDVKGIRATKK